MSEATKTAWRETLRALVPIWGGLGVGIVFSLGSVELTMKKCLFWSGAAVGIPCVVWLLFYCLIRYSEKRDVQN